MRAVPVIIHMKLVVTEQKSGLKQLETDTVDTESVTFFAPSDLKVMNGTFLLSELARVFDDELAAQWERESEELFSVKPVGQRLFCERLGLSTPVPFPSAGKSLRLAVAALDLSVSSTLMDTRPDASIPNRNGIAWQRDLRLMQQVKAHPHMQNVKDADVIALVAIHRENERLKAEAEAEAARERRSSSHAASKGGKGFALRASSLAVASQFQSHAEEAARGEKRKRKSTRAADRHELMLLLPAHHGRRLSAHEEQGADEEFEDEDADDRGRDELGGDDYGGFDHSDSREEIEMDDEDELYSARAAACGSTRPPLSTAKPRRNDHPPSPHRSRPLSKHAPSSNGGQMKLR